MKDDSIACNTGHFDCEIDMSKNTGERIDVKIKRDPHCLKNGRHAITLAEGRLVTPILHDKKHLHQPGPDQIELWTNTAK